MAQAKNLNIGQSYDVREGAYKGQTLKVLDNKPVPDGEPNQRKILVELLDGSTDYVLPKVINDGTVTPAMAQKIAEGHLSPPVAAPVQAPVAPAPAPQEVAVEDHKPITDPMDPRLDVYRPDPSIVDAYVARELPGGLKDIDTLLRYWRERKNLMLVGDTQSGKSMVIRVVAVLAAREAGLPKPYPVFTLSGSSGVSDYDLFGQNTAYTGPDNVERLVWLPGLPDIAARVGGFLELDEANMFDDRVITALNSLTDDRRSFINRQHAVKVEGDGFMPEVVNAHEEMWVVGSYNDGYRGAGALQEAFANRFTHIPWDYDEKVESTLIKTESVRIIGQAVRNAREKNLITTPVGTRALQEMEAAAHDTGSAEFAVWAFAGMFPGRDRERVELILRDRSAVEILQAEVDAVAAGS